MQASIKTKDKGKNQNDLERLPTNTLSFGNRVQRWGNFIAGFSIEFVELCLRGKNPESKVVIDPFLGCGTTLVAAKNLGFNTVGVEAHPLFFTLAKGKLGNYSTVDLQRIKEILTERVQQINWSSSANEFINKMYHAADIDAIRYASFQLQFVPERLRPLATAIFLKACEFSCTAQTDGIYKAPKSKKKTIPFGEAINNAISIFFEDVQTDWYRDHWMAQPTPKLFHSSSELLEGIEDNSVDVCITSPPYLNNFDYGEMTRLQLYLLGWADSWGDISGKVRNHLITNTTTALSGKKTQTYQEASKSDIPDELHSELGGIVKSLTEQRRFRTGKKEYDYLVYPYYSQINAVVKGLHRTLKRDGEIYWVVADAALYGIHIKTHEHMKALFEKVGFNCVEIRWMRKRGHRWILNKRDGAVDELGEYCVYAKK
jgi:DNA modification methylase